MILTLHKSQVDCSGVMQRWACCSRMFTICRGKLAKFTSGLFYCWSLWRNNNMATNRRKFTSRYESGRFSACAVWTQTFSRHAPRQDVTSEVAKSFWTQYWMNAASEAPNMKQGAEILNGGCPPHWSPRWPRLFASSAGNEVRQWLLIR